MRYDQRFKCRKDKLAFEQLKNIVNIAANALIAGQQAEICKDLCRGFIIVTGAYIGIQLV